jgi:formylglycine-generating enzyme required for sulfatase activity
LIPAGTFTMGQVSIADTVHSVSLSSFWIDSTEVTQTDYVSLMGVNPSYLPSVTNGPVEQVTWFDAVLYCNKRSKRDGLDTVYSYTAVTGTPGNGCTALAGLGIALTKSGYRLPTEAQWEYACRGGKTTQYYWGDANDNATIGLYAWFLSNSGSTTHSVATKAPNAYGLYDMSGNVWEWCNDWWSSPYSSNALTNPTGPVTGTNRLLRGGGYIGSYIYSAYRYSNYPYIRSDLFGFRVALPTR